MKRKRIFLGVALCAVLVLAASVVGCSTSHHIKTAEGHNRGYNLFVPTAAQNGDGPFPLVIALHQFSDTAQGMENLTGFSLLAESEGFLVAYPQGRFRVWNAGQQDSPDDVAFIEAMIDAITQEHPVDPARIYAVGASAGGMMSQWLACKSERFAAIATVMGSQPQDVMANCASAHSTPCLVIHGTTDPVIPFGGGETYAGPGRKPVFLSAEETASFWAEKNGCDGEAAEEALPVVDKSDATRITLHTYPCDDEKEVLFYEVIGGGHTWPGRDNWYPEFIVGETTMQMDATSTIWGFFKDKKMTR